MTSPSRAEYLEALAEATVPIIEAVHGEGDPRPAIRAALALEASEDLSAFMDRFFSLLHIVALQVPRGTSFTERTNPYHADVVAACRKTAGEVAA